MNIDFDINFYKNIYKNELQQMSDIEIMNYYINNGINNNHLYSLDQFYKLFPNFDINFYKNFHDDLKNLNNYDLYKHYYYHTSENRIISEIDFHKRYINFNIIIYKYLNNDLINFTDIQLYKHFHHHGKNENRNYKIIDFYKVYPNFDINIYKKFNDDNSIEIIDTIKKYLLDKNNSISNLLDFYKLYPDFNIKLYKVFNNNNIRNFSEKFINKIFESTITKLLKKDLKIIYNKEDEYKKNIEENEENIEIIYNFYKIPNKNKIVYSLKTFYTYFPDFNYDKYRKNNSFINDNDLTELDIILYWYNYECNDKTIKNIPKNIIIYPHMNFDLSNGGVTVQYYFAKLLEQYNFKVRIYQRFNNYNNSIFNNYYNNDFDLDNTIVIYCEGVSGNPLNAKYVVRWLLSELGKNVKKDIYKTWNKSDLVYYFNSELKFYEKKELIDNIYKNLTLLYINPNITNITNKELRKGYCHTFRKSNYHEKLTKFNYIHPTDSFEIFRSHTQDDYIEIFNKYEYFVSYDPLTFLNVISALCGCISIVYPIRNMNKEKWIMITGVEEYFQKTGAKKELYGIAYGKNITEIQFAQNTLHLVKKQWDDITKFYKENHIKRFINDIYNFEYMQNTVYNNF
jgi:hypothetical protein